MLFHTFDNNCYALLRIYSYMVVVPEYRLRKDRLCSPEGIYTLHDDSQLYTVQKSHRHLNMGLCSVHSGRLDCWGIQHQVCILGDNLVLVPYSLAGKNMLVVFQPPYIVNWVHKAKDCKDFQQEQE